MAADLIYNLFEAVRRTLLMDESVDKFIINSTLSIIEWRSTIRTFLTIPQILSTGWHPVEPCEDLPNHPTMCADSVVPYGA